MNEVAIDISGTVVTDPVLRQTKTGDAFLTFRMAVNERRWNAQENTPMIAVNDLLGARVNGRLAITQKVLA